MHKFVITEASRLEINHLERSWDQSQVWILGIHGEVKWNQQKLTLIRLPNKQ